MKALKALLAVLPLLALPALAQTPAQVKAELKNKEAAAKKDPDALYEAGKWAADKGLANEAKRIFLAVLKIKPDHEGANVGLGNAKFDGKWLPAKEAAALQKKADAAAFAAKGMVEVDGVWVDKEHVDDAKKGVFHHDGQLVTKEEKLALLRGFVRHPDTDELIDPKYLDKAKEHLFPIGREGRWVDEKEADKFHADEERPWTVRSAHCTLVSNLPLAQLRKLKLEADRGFERASHVLGSARPKPKNRPVLLIAETLQKYQHFGAVFSDGTDVAGAFLANDREDAQVRVPYLGVVRPAVAFNEKDLGPYYVRHAAAMAALRGVADDVGADLPPWFYQAVGSLASRFIQDHDAAWFGKQQMQRGGVRKLKGFFGGFGINGEMEPSEVSAQIYLAGLMLAYASSPGAEPGAAGAFKAIVAAFTDSHGGKVASAVEKLQHELIGKEDKISAYLQELVKKSP